MRPGEQRAQAGDDPAASACARGRAPAPRRPSCALGRGRRGGLRRPGSAGAGAGFTAAGGAGNGKNLCAARRRGGRRGRSRRQRARRRRTPASPRFGVTHGVRPAAGVLGRLRLRRVAFVRLDGARSDASAARGAEARRPPLSAAGAGPGAADDQEAEDAGAEDRPRRRAARELRRADLESWVHWGWDSTTKSMARIRHISGPASGGARREKPVANRDEKFAFVAGPSEASLYKSGRSQ